jgi:aminopeptidase N
MKIYLDPKLLKNNQTNTVVILFTSKYTNNGSGLHAYIDPSDGKSYLYTQFEPFDCHQVFPCFDQPDVKATLKLSVIAPSEWNVFSNEEEVLNKPLNQNTINDIDVESVFETIEEVDENFLFVEKVIDDGKTNIHTFKKTPKISPYLFALCAGQYYTFQNPYEFRVPMKLMVRDSVKKFGELKEIFKITMAGINYYENLFGQVYPFSKYDQIFCPEYNMGAMENVGLVTLNEYYCWRSKPTQRQRTGFAITNLHELAHMWFGNLVTMTWWDDLWLNESFATFISHLCLDNAPELKEYSTSWLIFNSLKGGAYRADQLSTTHPVMSEVKNTDVAETHFDEIVYEKGSSLLKQIYYCVGKESFANGLKEYFREYNWGNTVFSEFIGKLIEAMPENKNDLYSLCANWLQKAGLNELKACFKHEDGLLTEFLIEQTPCLESHPNRQLHVMDIQLVYSDGKTIDVNNVTINPEKITNLSNLFVGKRLPDAVILNHNDWAYFKWIPDDMTLSFMQKYLGLISNNLTKQMIYRALFDLVRDARFNSLNYLEIVKNYLVEETDQDIFTTTMRHAQGVISNYIPINLYEKYSEEMFNVVLKLLK